MAARAPLVEDCNPSALSALQIAKREIHKLIVDRFGTAMHKCVSSALNVTDECRFFLEALQAKVIRETQLPCALIEPVQPSTNIWKALEKLIAKLTGEVSKGRSVKAVDEDLEQGPEQQDNGEPLGEAGVIMSHLGWALAFDPDLLEEDEDRPRNGALHHRREGHLFAVDYGMHRLEIELGAADLAA